MEALDTNHDGELSAEEIANAPALLKKLDKNGDGKLTEDELHPRADRAADAVADEFGRGPAGRRRTGADHRMVPGQEKIAAARWRRTRRPGDRRSRRADGGGWARVGGRPRRQRTGFGRAVAVVAGGQPSRERMVRTRDAFRC